MSFISFRIIIIIFFILYYNCRYSISQLLADELYLVSFLLIVSTWWHHFFLCAIIQRDKVPDIWAVK